MAFKDLHKLKKVVVVEKEYIEVPHLVVGKDIFAVTTYKALQEKYGKEKVRLLSEDAILKSDLMPKGPGTIRGEANQAVMKQIFPEAIVHEGNEMAMFYKDMTWKSFGGRSKSEALKFNEEFYTTPRLDIDPEKIFPELVNAEQFLEEINQEAYQIRLKSIKRVESGFSVECLNGTEFKCEKLYFDLSPSHYLNFYTNKNELSDTFIQFCESTHTPSALFVKFVFDKPITDIKETLFIPLSYTHEWGHFVGEFNVSADEAKAGQDIEFIHYIDEDSSSEEDISRIIRLLKKSMEKIFDKFSKTKATEYIVLEQDIGCLKIDDQLFARVADAQKNETNNLFFLGMNAPIVDTQSAEFMFEYSKEGVNMLTRALLVHSILLKKI